MMLVVVTVAGAVVVGWARGGRLANLGSVSLRAPALVVVSLAAQLGSGLLDPGLGRTAALVGSQLALLAFAGANRVLPGVGLVALGTLLNGAVVAVNGAMPVDRRALLAVARQPYEIGDGPHRLLEPGDPLPWLADVIALPVLRTIVSVGDVVLAAGIGILVLSLMRRHRGLGSRSTSAASAP